MADFDDALNGILSNPAAMARIAQLAQSFSGGQNGPPPAGPPGNPAPGGNPVPPPPPDRTPGDMETLSRLVPLLQELGGQRDSNARKLLYALRPYLRPRRQEKIERALQLARLFCVGKKFLSEWEG